MKPIYLEFEAFGPYLNKQTIDFSLLSKDGLFLICGDTGSGKTVILDAITFCLYGESSGGKRGDITNMITHHAKSDVKMNVEFVFEIAQKKYKFIRSLRKVRGKSENYVEEANALFYEKGEFKPFFANPKKEIVKSKAIELIGLDYKQFSSVIVLPQGQFEKLLVADSKEKEEIVSTLFNANLWEQVALNIKKSVDVNSEALKRRKLLFENGLMYFKVASFGELQTLYEAKMRDKKEAQNELILSDDNLNLMNKEYQEALKYREILANRDELLLKISNLKSSEEKMLDKEKMVEALNKAVQLKPLYDEICIINNKTNKINGEIFGINNVVNDFEMKLVEAKNIFEKLKNNQNNIENIKEEKTKLDTLEKFYLVLDEKRADLEHLNFQIKSCVQSENIINKELETIQCNINENQYQLKNLKAHRELMIADYYRFMSVELAEGLKEGEECPVCGSKEHPRVASICVENRVRKKDVDELEEKIKKIDAQFDELNGVYNTCKQKYLQIQIDITEKRANISLVKNDIDNLLKAINVKYQTFSEVKKRILQIDLMVNEHNNKIEIVQCTIQQNERTLNSKLGERTEKAQNLRQLEGELKERMCDFDGKLKKNNFNSLDEFKKVLQKELDMNKIVNELDAYKTDYKATISNFESINKKMQGMKQYDVDSVLQSYEELLKTNKRHSLKVETLILEISSIEKMLNTLAIEQKEIIKFEEQQAQDEMFKKILCGEKGVSLHRYVLGAMFIQVVKVANEMLSEINFGRYRLLIGKNDDGRKKGGLDLEVFDNLTNKPRQVSTLSGGEKFLVSLALSIGLSTVVQAQSGGIKISSMFIDEGFGTLDNASIDEAILILKNVKQTNGFVGIISHVQQLKENIAARIEVTKEKSGSSLKIVL